MLRGIVFILLSCIALATPAVAQNTAPEKPVVKLGIGSKIQIPYLAVNIAEHKGYFKEQGLTIEFNDFGGGGSDSLKALVSGSVDFIAGAYEHTLYMQARGQAITSVALQNNSFGVVVALSKEKAATYKSPKDLVGLKIGVTAPGSSSALALSLLMSKANLPADQISIIGVGAGNSALAMMKSGRLDGEANFDPVITRLVLDGDLVPVVDTRTKAGLDYLYGGPFAGSAISTTPDFIKSNPKTVQALVNGMVKALHWLQKASVDEIADALPPEFYAGDKEFYKKAVQANREMLSKDGIVTPALSDNTYRIISSFNENVRNAKIDMAKTYDASFAVNANKAMR
ncbi:MAG: ABC transporter substrate-binding protein [Pseudolabrys sp.]|jgi:NitT/TauT family transport system substrate-binding protein